MNEIAKYYILQQHAPNTDLGFVNSFYAKDKDGNDISFLGHPEYAMRFNTFGEAMKESANVLERTGIHFKVFPIYKDF